MYALRC